MAASMDPLRVIELFVVWRSPGAHMRIPIIHVRQHQEIDNSNANHSAFGCTHGQAESLVRSVFRWMTPIERFNFVAIKHPSFCCFMVEGLCRGLEE